MADDARTVIDSTIWDDQAAFNALLRTAPETPEARAELVKDMVLNLTDEAHELLRVGVWKKHRNVKRRPNPAHVREELADILKIFITLCQASDVTLEELVQAYWDKSAVVRYRYLSEWATAATEKPYAVIDIDGVLCDYTTGFADWMLQQPCIGQGPALWGQRLREMRDANGWLSASTTGVDPEVWEEAKHVYRTTGMKRYLPVYPDARGFLTQLCICYTVVLLTSRPIDRYPNLLTDTVAWLHRHELPYDFIWWNADKTSELIERSVLARAAFAVDDDLRYVEKYREHDIPVVHLLRGRGTLPPARQDGSVWLVSDLVQTQQIVGGFRR